MESKAVKFDQKRSQLRTLKKKVRWSRRAAVIVLLVEIAAFSGFLMYKNWDLYKVPSEWTEQGGN